MPVHPLSSRGINKFHLEGDCHLESNIEAIKVYQFLSKLSRSFASYESSKPHEYNLNNIRDMKNSEATKQSMLPDTSTCVVDHNEELSKDSVTDYVTKTDEKSVPISCDRARAEAVHAPRDREPSRINSLQENVELVQKDKVIRECMVHCLNKDLPSSFELRKCLSLALENIISLYLDRNSDVIIFESRRF